MMANMLPPWAIKEIDAICRKFLWVGKDESVSDKCLVAWKTACRPTELSGLGITDLRLAGYTLQSWWLWLQKTDSARAWSELPLNVDSEVQAFFQALAFTKVGDNSNSLFWDDRWINQTAPYDMAPQPGAPSVQADQSSLDCAPGDQQQELDTGDHR
jgi:hypothetical protein